MVQKKEKSISKKSILSILVILISLLVISIVLTFILPKGEFGVFENGDTNYSQITLIENMGGIPLWKGILSPILVFFSSDGISLVFLSLFILSINATFYLMEEIGGIKAIVETIVKRFENRKILLLIVISFLFYCFGAFLGLFEEVITLLPIICAICISIGYDSFTGFLCCILSCGFGFASAITNPFTVLLASQIIGVNPMEKIWLRLIIFIVMFAFLQSFIFLYTKKIKKHPELSLTYNFDHKKKDSISMTDSEIDSNQKKRLIKGYVFFFSVSLLIIVVSSLIPLTRHLTVAILMFYTLIFGFLTPLYVTGNLKDILQKCLHGFVLGLPAVAFISIAASIKYVFVEGRILPTIVFQINKLSVANTTISNAFIIFLIVLVLEFFVSSSTAKAFIVMGILSMVNAGLSSRMSVLLYTLGDGYTNVFFPTSPVLLIALSMIEVEYLKWIKKSVIFIIGTFILLTIFILLGLAMGY